MVEFLKIADIGESGKQKVIALEKSIGAHVMAYDSGYKLAQLTEAQRAELAALEQELGQGIFLLAYEK